MGFGLLFIGYFFLINITYYAYTDVIAAMLMMMAFYKLSFVNRYFRYSFWVSGAFALFGAAELVLAFLKIFDIYSVSDLILSYISVVRYVFIFFISALMLTGIRTVAKEVDAERLAKSASATPLCAVYLIAALLNLPIEAPLGVATPYVFTVVIIALIAYHIMNIITVYRAYAEICMPNDNKKKKSKRKGFTDKLYDRIEERSREYNEYKLNRAKNRNNTKRRK